MITNSFPVSLCPTGMVPKKKDNSHTPISAKEIIDDVKQCAEIGITSVHIHARREDETPAWEKFYFEQIVSGIRSFDENIEVCVAAQLDFPFFRDILIEELIYLDHSGGEIIKEFIQ